MGLGANKGILKLMKEYKHNPSKVLYDTLNDVIDNHNKVYHVNKQDLIAFLKGKIKVLEG